LSWLVYRMTHSPFLMGFTTFITLIPSFILGTLGGVIADRHNRHKLVLITQVLEMVQAFIFAYFILSGHITLPYIFLFAGLLGAIHAFDMPARQSFIVEIVPQSSLPSAIALNSSLFNAGRIIGPSLAGILIAFSSEGYCFLINGITYLFVVIALIKIRTKKKKTVKHATTHFESLLEGLRYAFGTPHTRWVLILLSVSVFCGTPYLTFMPIYANDILHRGAEGLGILMGVSGIGAFLGGIFLGGKKGVRGLATLIGISISGFGVSMMLFAYATHFIVSCIFIFSIGFCMLAGLVSSNLLLQLHVPDKLRGRLMSIYATTIVGIMPIGSLLSGIVARYVGVEIVTFIGGLFAAIAGICFLLKAPKGAQDIPITLEEYEEAIGMEQ